MDCLGSDHLISQRRFDVIIETVFSVSSVQRLYTEIPRITEAVQVSKTAVVAKATSSRA
jgi:hypothetical protein